LHRQGSKFIAVVQAGYAHVFVLATQVIPTLHTFVPHWHVVKLVFAVQFFNEHDAFVLSQTPPKEQMNGTAVPLVSIPMQTHVFCSVFPLPKQFGIV